MYLARETPAYVPGFAAANAKAGTAASATSERTIVRFIAATVAEVAAPCEGSGRSAPRPGHGQQDSDGGEGRDGQHRDRHVAELLDPLGRARRADLAARGLGLRMVL